MGETTKDSNVTRANKTARIKPCPAPHVKQDPTTRDAPNPLAELSGRSQKMAAEIVRALGAGYQFQHTDRHVEVRFHCLAPGIGEVAELDLGRRPTGAVFDLPPQ